jgi:hypothetical protein
VIVVRPSARVIPMRRLSLFSKALATSSPATVSSRPGHPAPAPTTEPCPVHRACDTYGGEVRPGQRGQTEHSRFDWAHVCQCLVDAWDALCRWRCGPGFAKTCAPRPGNERRLRERVTQLSRQTGRPAGRQTRT